MMYWNECKTTDDLWEAARTQHLIMCITRSLDCDIDKCKKCTWHPFDKEGWQPAITKQAASMGVKE